MIDFLRDGTVEAIALMLRQAVESRHPGAIAGISAFDTVPADPALYPHLSIYRTDARGPGLERCKGIARYMAFSPIEREQLPGRFRAIALAISSALRNADLVSDSLWQIAPDQDFVYRERILGIQNGLIPFFEIEFEFHDFAI